jgi:hypothetical protein
MNSRNKPTTATKAAAPAQSGRRRRTRTAKSASGDRGSPSLGDQILALAMGKTGQDPRGRREDAARREQPRDEGVLSCAVDVRSDLLRGLRASSPPHTGHLGVRAGVGAPCSPPWTTPTASATARRFTDLRTACSRATFSAATSC